MKYLMNGLCVAGLLSSSLAVSEEMTVKDSLEKKATEEVYEYRVTPKANQVDDLRDDDGDGVINARDLCVNTPEFAEIDNEGCSDYVRSSEQLELRVLFANDSDKISPLFTSQVQLMADFLGAYPKTTIELRGYASKTGTAEHNQQLSERRSETVNNLLVSFGVEPARIKTIGFGDTQLESDGSTEIDHALNRRVRATVVGYTGKVVDRWHIFTTIAK